MVDFTTPNLCGASPEFNKLSSQFSGIKDSLQGQLEGEIDVLKSELTASLAVLEADIKGLIPELPAIPDVSFISEIQNLAALPAGGFAGLSALANIQSQFGSALSGAGFSLDSLVGDATAAFSGGIDLCGGGLPNFVIGPNGLPALKPDDVGMPSTDPKRLDEDDDIEGEAASSLLTPSAEISSTNSGLSGAAGKASEEVKKRLPKTTISAEGGNVSLAARKEYDKQDALIEANNIKNKVPSSPQIQKRANAAATNSNLPAKAPATSPDEILVEIQGFQERVNIASNAFRDSFTRTQGLFKKSKQESPHNLLASGKAIVRDETKTFSAGGRSNLNFKKNGPSAGKLMGAEWKFYFTSAGLAEIKINNGISANNAGGIETRVIEVEELSKKGVTLAEEVYDGLEKTYAVAPGAPASSGLTIVSVRDLGFVKQFRLSDGREVSENQLAGLGLSPS
mgnify:FL=1